MHKFKLQKLVAIVTVQENYESTMSLLQQFACTKIHDSLVSCWVCGRFLLFCCLDCYYRSAANAIICCIFSGELCKSVIYCSTKCANDDWSLEHGIWCARIAEIVKTFEVSQCQHTELARNDFEALLLPHFLASRGLHGKGLWSLFVQPPTDATQSK